MDRPSRKEKCTTMLSLLASTQKSLSISKMTHQLQNLLQGLSLTPEAKLLILLFLLLLVEKAKSLGPNLNK